MKILTSFKELASLMSLKWIEPSMLGFKQITLAKTNANDLKEVNRAGIQSTASHVKPCRKQGGPPSKAKDDLATDSA